MGVESNLNINEASYTIMLWVKQGASEPDDSIIIGQFIDTSTTTTMTVTSTTVVTITSTTSSTTESTTWPGRRWLSWCIDQTDSPSSVWVCLSAYFFVLPSSAFDIFRMLILYLLGQHFATGMNGKATSLRVLRIASERHSTSGAQRRSAARWKTAVYVIYVTKKPWNGWPRVAIVHYKEETWETIIQSPHLPSIWLRVKCLPSLSGSVFSPSNHFLPYQSPHQEFSIVLFKRNHPHMSDALLLR